MMHVGGEESATSDFWIYPISLKVVTTVPKDVEIVNKPCAIGEACHVFRARSLLKDSLWLEWGLEINICCD